MSILVNNGTNQPQCGHGDHACDHMSCPSFVTESLRKNPSCNFTITNLDSNVSYVLDVNMISEYPDGYYSMSTTACFPYDTEKLT